MRRLDKNININLLEYADEFKTTLKNHFNQASIKPLLFILGIYLLAYSAIILADVYYADDVARSITGARGWDNFSRYTTNLLSSLLNFSDNLTDIYPLGIFIAIILLTISSFVLASLFNKSANHNYYIYAASTLLGLNPYFLENISYKYDSPYMSLAILGCIFPFIFLKHQFFKIISVFSLLIMWTTYQAANMIYIEVGCCIILMNCLHDQKSNGKKIIANLTSIFTAFIISLIIFKIFFYHVETVDYVNNKMISHPKQLIDNIINYWLIMLKDFKDSNLLIFLVLSYFSLIIKIIISQFSRTQIIIATFGFTLLGIFSYGLYCILEQPLYKPRALNGIGGFVALMLIINLLIKGDKFDDYFSKILCFLVIMNTVIIALTYGNALKNQKEYMNFRTQLMLSDLNKLMSESEHSQSKYAFNPSKYIDIRPNRMQLAPSVEHAAEVFPIVGTLISIQGRWTHLALRHYSINFRVNTCRQDKGAINTVDTIFHKIKQYPNNCFEVEYKNDKKINIIY